MLDGFGNADEQKCSCEVCDVVPGLARQLVYMPTIQGFHHPPQMYCIVALQPCQDAARQFDERDFGLKAPCWLG